LKWMLNNFNHENYNWHTQDRWRYWWHINEDGKWSGLKRLGSGETAKIIKEISDNAPSDCIFVTGVGSHQQHAARHLSLDTPRRILLTSAGHGCMGSGLPMAIGAAIATGRKVVLIDGDGSFQMSMNELATLAKYNLPIDVNVIDNCSGGIVSQFARLQGYDPIETTWGQDISISIPNRPDRKWTITVNYTKEEGVWPILEGGHQMDDMTWFVNEDSAHGVWRL